MASDFKSIPIIDICPLLDKCNDPKMAEDPGVYEVVKKLDQACREIGFFHVEGHDIPDSLAEEVREVTRKFAHLPFEEKIKIKMYPETGFRGYQRIGETIAKGLPDMHEAFNCFKEVEPGQYGTLSLAMEGSNLWPNNPPNCKQLMEEYITLLRDLSRSIMRGIAVALGGSPDAFDGERAGDPFWVMRMVSGARTDYGLLTLVNQDDDITALPPNFDAVIEPLDFCKQKTGGLSKFEPVIYGEHIVRKVTANFVM